MLTSKQRAYLRGLANGIDPIFHVGKGGVTPEFTDSVEKALDARELVKINVLDNNLLGPREVAQTIAERTHADVVQVIGNRFVLYKAAKKPVIELPKAAKK
ncbi:MAG: YhbY family RNA-binding protein [Firmicutes bacterium]|nr:YhbY family RNA-binding protein [Bacillota bacterium]